MKEKENMIIFEERDFNPRHIFECGQAFRWEAQEDGSYIAIAFGRVIKVSQEGDQISIHNISQEDFDGLWRPYFDLDTDYGQVKKAIPQNTDMEKAMDFGYGIRILRQEIYETIISFIISANNRIPMIKNSIEKISQRYGDFIETYEAKDYYSFPAKEVLARAKAEDLREHCRVGFRDERIVKASQMLLAPSYDEEVLKNMDTPDLRKKLMDLPGVGPKVADCILLFAFARSEVFPVDVWIKRVMEVLYIHKEVSNKEIVKYANDIFGANAGYAQQYLFYYGRENDIGK